MAVAISSIQGKVGVPFHSGYSASKHAVQGLCDSLRLELRGQGVQVLTVLAHWIRGTRMRERALGQDGAPRGATSASHGSSAIPVEDVTRAVLDAIRRRRRSCFVPAHLWLLACLSELAPGLADRIIVRAVEREARRH
jgi:short-subunit dehydrogenase